MQIDDTFNVTAKDFCKIIGVSYRHFKRLRQEEVFDGCEGLQKSRWDLTKVVQAWVRYNINKDEDASGEAESADLKAARIRNLDAQSDLRELEYEEQLNQMISIEDATDVIVSAFAGIRTALNSLSGRSSHKFASIDSPGVIKKMLKKDIENCLEHAQSELGTYITRQEDLPDGEGHGGSQASAESNPGTVGESRT